MNDRPPSPLEHALGEFSEGRIEPDAFLGQFFETEVFVPTLPPDDGAERQFVADGTESFSLITVDVDGRETLAIFDDLDRFEEWAGDNDSPIGYLGMPAGVLIDSIDPGLAVALFAGADGVRLFDPETVGQIRAWRSEPRDGPGTIAAGTAVRFTDIEVPPDGLIEAMIAALGSLGGEVEEARLTEFAEADSPGSERLMVVLTLAAGGRRSFEAIVDAVTQSVKPVLGDIAYLDFMDLTGSEFRSGLEDSVAPFFVERERGGR